jgi:hypothetical protein
MDVVLEVNMSLPHHSRGVLSSVLLGPGDARPNPVLSVKEPCRSHTPLTLSIEVD